MRKWACLCLVFTLCMSACSVSHIDDRRVAELSYTVESEDNLPEEVRPLLDGAKGEPFQLVYQYEDYLYIMKGYGKKETGGYSVQIEDCYVGENAIYIKTDIIGPPTQQEATQEASYPFVAIKTEYRDLPVIFL